MYARRIPWAMEMKFIAQMAHNQARGARRTKSVQRSHSLVKTDLPASAGRSGSRPLTLLFMGGSREILYLIRIVMHVSRNGAVWFAISRGRCLPKEEDLLNIHMSSIISWRFLGVTHKQARLYVIKINRVALTRTITFISVISICSRYVITSQGNLKSACFAMRFYRIYLVYLENLSL